MLCILRRKPEHKHQAVTVERLTGTVDLDLDTQPRLLAGSTVPVKPLDNPQNTVIPSAKPC
jgi:hypothetical protein